MKPQRRQRSTLPILIAMLVATGLRVRPVLCRHDHGVGGTNATSASPDTVVVVDAGSSGCRLYVYRMEGQGEAARVLGTAGGKIEPGLSTFAEKPHEAAAYIWPLLSRATELVPEEKHASTKIKASKHRLVWGWLSTYAFLREAQVFIKSTAGMRLLPTETQDAIYDEMYKSLAGEALFPFPLERADVGTIDGDEEAFYAVLSANYLEGRIDARLHPTGHEAGEIGALDMGGASTQIIFRQEAGMNSGENQAAAVSRGASNGTAHDAASLLLEEAIAVQSRELGGPVSPSSFWGTSHLGFGVLEVRRRIWDFLVDRHVESGADTQRDIRNPCSFANRVDFWRGFRLVGSGDHVMCEAAVESVLWGWPASREEAECGSAAEVACGVGGVGMPAVRGDFVAMSAFFYAMHCMKEMGPGELDHWPAPTLSELRQAAHEFCAMEWETLSQTDRGADHISHTASEEALAHRCVEVVYMTTLLRDGYGFPEDARSITFALESDGMELEWTLGYALAELAASVESTVPAGKPPELRTAAIRSEPAHAARVDQERSDRAAGEGSLSSDRRATHNPVGRITNAGSGRHAHAGDSPRNGSSDLADADADADASVGGGCGSDYFMGEGMACRSRKEAGKQACRAAVDGARAVA